MTKRSFTCIVTLAVFSPSHVVAADEEKEEQRLKTAAR
jgi:hypothetical protein